MIYEMHQDPTEAWYHLAMLIAPKMKYAAVHEQSVSSMKEHPDKRRALTCSIASLVERIFMWSGTEPSF